LSLYPVPEENWFYGHIGKESDICMMNDNKAKQEAEHFLNNEKQFHLGMLPTEQSNPKTRNIDLKFEKDPADGAALLLSVDRDVQSLAKKILKGNEFLEMVDAGLQVIASGGKIVFSGCGSTGRLSILLEAMWRYFFRDMRNNYPDIYTQIKKNEDRVFSIMTGGDYAMIRSVEYFEDYREFGKQQVREMEVSSGDMLIAITEGGETSSVLGTVEEAADRGAKVFLLFNNPVPVLVQYIERSRRAIEDPRVTVLELYCGPMAIAGSTRMQATTAGLLIAGAALEIILSRSIKPLISQHLQQHLNIREMDYAMAFNALLDELLTARNTESLASYINLEKEIYQEKGLVTYYADDHLLDIFTDTTERAPTFMLPPFRKSDDLISPVSWAFVKSPLRPTAAVWEHMLGRSPRCLEWDSKRYRQMGVPESLAAAPPKLDNNEIVKFLIGNEKDDSRFSRTPNIAVSILGSAETLGPSYNVYQHAFQQNAARFTKQLTLIIGNSGADAEYRIACNPASSVLNLMERLAVKLILNTVSTGTMVLLGRVTGNWMSCVEISNKKLRDRGIRLISEICGLSYRDACYTLHEAMEKLKAENPSGQEKLSPVQFTINQCRGRSSI
jgi:N-acetylmuramic acid 6-phosphate etherase